MGVAAAVVGLALGAVGAKKSYDAASDSAEAQQDINNQNAAVNAQKRMEEKRAAARRRRITAARVEQAAENSGVGTGSALQGTLGSLSTQYAAGQAGLNTRVKAESAITQSQNDMADSRVDDALGQGIASLGQSIFSYGMNG